MTNTGKKKIYLATFIVFITLILLIIETNKKIEVEQEQIQSQTFPESAVTSHLPEIDLDSIISRGKLVALTRYNANSFFLYRGQPMGYEYELLKLFTEELGVELEIKIPSTRDSLFIMLNNGEGDLIAANLAITLERSENVDFSFHHNTTRQMLVQRKPENWRRQRRHVTEDALIRDPLDLIGHTVAVRRGSNYHQRLDNLMHEIGGVITIDTMPNSYETDEIIRLVSEGEIEYTIADENIAEINSTVYPDLDMRTPISFSQRIAWAFRKSSPELRKAADEWMIKLRANQSPVYYVIYNKYYKGDRRFRQRTNSDYFSLETGNISAYDDLFKRYATDTLFPWTLLASQAYQESHFDPNTESWAGAVGLMQLMPATAEELGVTDMREPEQSVRAGALYLRKLYKNYWTELPDSEVVKFVLASYNAGPGHVLDAQRLAVYLNLDPNIWDDNVAESIRMLADPQFFYNEVVKYGMCRGEEPYDYVREIFQRKQIYDGFVEKVEADNIRDSLRLITEDSLVITSIAIES